MNNWSALRLTLVCVLALFLAALTDRAGAQSLDDLPTIATPGALAPSTEGRAWLSVAEPGIYRLSLDGPGFISIGRFRTEDGRSDGSDRLDEISRDGSPYVAGSFDDLLLEPGQSYFVQMIATEPRALILELVTPIDRATARDAGSGGDVALAPGTSILFATGDRAELQVALQAEPVRLDVITAPGSRAEARIGGQRIGPGGLYPVVIEDEEDLTLDGAAGPDGAPGLILVRSEAVPEGLDDIEPGPVALGAVPADGLDLRGVLLAPTDRDDFEFSLVQPGRYDLGVLLDDRSDAILRLIQIVDGSALEILSATADVDGARRSGLSLEAGDYRLRLEKNPDRPVGYNLFLLPARRIDPLTEGEPDDIPERARPLAPGTALLGHLGPEDTDYVTFEITDSGRLWEIRAVQGVSTLILSTASRNQIGQWNSAGGAVVLPLALPPGRYVARLRGEGRYAIRLSDAGPLPEGFETEPNNDEATAHRLFPAEAVQGSFLLGGDRELIEFTLDAPTPLTLRFRGPDDGPALADVKLSDGPTLRATVLPEHGEVSYSATFPAGRNTIDIRPSGERLSGRWQLALDRAETPESGEPRGVVALPRDGRLTGRIGGFDQEDRVFIALPEGVGQAVIACTGAIAAADLRTYGDDARVLRLSPDTAGVLDYAPDLGGAIEMRLTPAGAPGDYACQMAFPPEATTPQSLAHDEATDSDVPTSLLPGSRVSGQFDDDDGRDRVQVELPEGQIAGLLCLDDTGTPIQGRRIRATDNDALVTGLRSPSLSDGTYVFIGRDEAPGILEVRGEASSGNWSCELITADSFRTPSEMGPPAPFTASRDRAKKSEALAPASYDPEAALRVLSGGRPDWLSDTQVSDDLDVSLEVSGLDVPFRAFTRLGQRAALTLAVKNGAQPREVALSAQALADGWRVKPAEAAMTLGPNETDTVAFTLEVPPMQSAATRPALSFIARTGAAQRGVTVPISLEPTAPERDPARFWTAPAELRGGLDPMRYQLGARVVEVDGEAVDEDDAEGFAYLHDGDAPHSAIAGRWRADQMVFRLVEPAPVAGMSLHLRTVESRATWPDRVTLELSADGETWLPAFEVTPTASDRPQVYALPSPVRASHARLIRHGCRADPDCTATSLAEIGLIASPDWRLAEPVNLADPDLGGHVVFARMLGGSERGERVFDGKWNISLLTDGREERLSRANERRGNQVEAVIAFDEIRAARIATIGWVGNEDDKPRLEGADVFASVAGPAGPWQSVGRLLAPPEGEANSQLDLETPVWARFIKLVFERHPDEDRVLPDQIQIWEDPTAPPLHGFWENDRPEAGYEATAAPPPSTVGAPTGGASAETAVQLQLGQTVRSSVLLERNADWWRISIPDGPPREMTFRFLGMVTPDVSARLSGPGGEAVPLLPSLSDTGDRLLTALVEPGDYLLEIFEPPRSVAILWDTSGSVGAYIPRTLAAVRLWAQSLQPGRDRLQLLPFGTEEMLLDFWAERPDDVIPALIDLPVEASSDSETALAIAATALADEEGQRGIVIFTDAETSQTQELWGKLLTAQPKVVALSIDTSTREGEWIMKDWASVNGGHFQRVVGQAGLADGMDLAASLFRAPKGYALEVTATTVQEPEGTARLSLIAAEQPEAPPVGGAIEVILDASGSMLKRLPDGRRRIAVAHDALAGLVRETLPAGTPFAFRAFGLEVDACLSELVLPIGPLDPATAEAAIRDVPAINLARTAIAKSLALAAEDLSNREPPRVVVIVTDGEETCDGDVEAEIARINEAGIDLRLTIVGFAIDDEGLAQTFARWAEAGGGQYLAAGDAEGLSAAINEAITPRFALERMYLDGRVEPAGSIGLKAESELPAGRYRLIPLQTARGEPVEIFLETDADKTLVYDPNEGLVANGER